MTQTGGTSELAVIIIDEAKHSLPSFLLCVVGFEPAFRALAGAVGPGGHISPGGHFYRTLEPFMIGFLDRGDGSYAAGLRRAHEANGISSELLGMAVQWYLAINCMRAQVIKRDDLIDPLYRQALLVAGDFNADPSEVTTSRDTLHDLFTGVTVLPEMKVAIRAVLDFPAIREIIGDAPAEDIIRGGREYLPHEFVNQFL